MNDMMPQATQITRHKPTLPACLKAPAGEIKIPDPIITLIMILIAAIRPMFRVIPPTAAFFSATTAVWEKSIFNKYFHCRKELIFLLRS